jgi:hypothetical protein
MPIQEAVRESTHLVVVDDISKSEQSNLLTKVFVLIDICTSGSPTNDSKVTNNVLLPIRTQVTHSSDDQSTDLETEVISLDQKPYWGLSDSETSNVSSDGLVSANGTARVTSAVIRKQVSEYLRLAMDSLQWTEDIPEVHY